MTDVENKVIGLNRKPFVPPAAVEADPAAIVVDEASLALAQRLVERIKSGELRCLAFIALASGSPMSSFPVHEGVKFVDLAMLNIAAEALKEQVVNEIYGNSMRVGIMPDGEEVEIEDGDEGDDGDIGA